MLGVAESEQAQATLTTTDPDPPSPMLHCKTRASRVVRSPRAVTW